MSAAELTPDEGAVSADEENGANVSSQELLTEHDPAVAAELIPWRLVVPVCLLQIVEAFNSSSIFSYIGFMILDFGLLAGSEQPENSTGYYAGFLGAIFYVGQLGSSFVWGVLADRFGKRPVLLLGSAGTLITCLAFGFAWSFWFALLVSLFTYVFTFLTTLICRRGSWEDCSMGILGLPSRCLARLARAKRSRNCLD